MNTSKRNRLNAAQNHIAGAAYVSGECAQPTSAVSKPLIEWHSQQGPPFLYAQPDILSRGKFSKSHLYNLMARGHFPQPVLRQGPRFTRWSSVDVDPWFESPATWIRTHAPEAQAVAG